MKDINIIDNFLSPVSRWINRELLRDRQDRSICQRVQDNTGIPKIVTEAFIFIGVPVLVGKVLRRNRKI